MIGDNGGARAPLLRAPTVECAQTLRQTLYSDVRPIM